MTFRFGFTNYFSASAAAMKYNDVTETCLFFFFFMRPPLDCKEQLCLQVLRKINSKRIIVRICICHETHSIN